METRSKDMAKIEQGFTLIELMVVIAIIGIFAAIAVPNFIGWRPKHALNRAVNEYNSLLQRAKMVAIKNREDCTVSFSSTGYSIACQSLNVSINLDEYGSGVSFVNPSGGPSFPASSLTFNSRGLSNQGYVYFSNSQLKEYYRVGPLISGVIRRDSWNGSTWVSL